MVAEPVDAARARAANEDPLLKEPNRSLYRVGQPVRGLVSRFAYVAIVAAAFGLMVLGKLDLVLIERVRVNIADVSAPVLDALSRPAASVSELAREVRGLWALRDENSRLRAERDRLLQWQEAARRLQSENNALRGLLQFRAGPSAGFVTARVIADTGGAFAHTVLLNAGTREQVRKGQAVVTGEGLVGRIAEAGRSSSRVLLITDLNSRVPVVVEASRVRAIMSGDNSDFTRLIHAPPGAVFEVGERIVTSGHGGVFPPGLPVGVVVRFDDGIVAVKPFVDRGRIEYVRVIDFGLNGIIGTAPGAAPRAALP